MTSSAGTAASGLDRGVVIVGGGIVGASVAFHLAERGFTDVTVVERHRIGEGSTARATGGIRQQFTSRVNAAMVHRSIGFWTGFEERTGAPFDFRRHGYLFLLTTGEQLATFQRAVAMQNELGIDSRIISADEVAELVPGTITSDVLGASYCASDGSGSPTDAVNGLITAARRLGVTVRQGCEVTGLLTEGDKVTGVRTSEGDLRAGLVLIATGPQAREVGQRLGIELPVAPHRRQAFAVDRMDWLRPDMPLTVDLGSGAYIHPEVSGAAIIGGNDRDVPEGTDTTVDSERVEPLVKALVDRWPRMADARVSRGWAGLREMTPDDHAVIGPVGPDGLWAAVGFSGHGFMQAPAVGECLTAWWLDGASPYDLTPLRPGRFADGQPVVEEGVF
jgi:glycine/D-amino acid oxidase-like deaminating enzyme